MMHAATMTYYAVKSYAYERCVTENQTFLHDSTFLLPNKSSKYEERVDAYEVSKKQL